MKDKNFNINPSIEPIYKNCVLFGFDLEADESNQMKFGTDEINMTINENGKIYLGSKLIATEKKLVDKLRNSITKKAYK